MDSPEQISEQEQRIASLIERAIEKVREEFLERLEEMRGQVKQLVHGEGAATAEPAAAEGLVAPVAIRDGGASLESLHGAISAVDRGRSQTEILTALLKGGLRFASRSVLLLAREEGLQGWAASGFGTAGEKVDAVLLPYGEETPWSRLAAGRGGPDLSASDCAELCGPIDGSRPAGGLLIPMVLRDRIAACLYADRLSDDELLDRLALQLLTFVTGQAIETLPLRERRSTATLRLSAEAPAEEIGLPLWEAAATEPAVEEELAAPATAAEQTPEAEMAEAMGTAPEETTPLSPLADREPAAISEPAPIDSFEAPTLEEAVTEPEPLQPAQESGFAVEPAEEMEPPEELEPAQEVEPAEEMAPPMVEEPSEGTQELGPPPGAEPTEWPPFEPPSVEPPTTPQEPIRPAATGAEIAPPDDLEGPGWAFTTTLPSPNETGDRSKHE
ncbi:MAG: hypothetical protein V3R89_06030, partial [Thermoanaerobaculia bacterium]